MAGLEIVCQLKPYIQPFERILAIKELEALSGARPLPELNSDADAAGSTEPLTYRVQLAASSSTLADRLTYWERVYPNGNPFSSELTRQVRREATTNLIKNGIIAESVQSRLPFGAEILLPNRRNLRYGPHGIHEYRGKFFPQLVRSLLNIAGAGSTSLILDPMCGSGTTPTEAVLFLS